MQEETQRLAQHGREYPTNTKQKSHHTCKTETSILGMDKVKHRCMQDTKGKRGLGAISENDKGETILASTNFINSDENPMVA